MHRSSDSAPVPRRDFLRVLGGAAAGFLSLTAARSLGALEQAPRAGQPPKKAAPVKAAAASRAIVIYKDPNCGCCKEWVKHVQAAGFTPTVHDTGDMAAVKSSMGMPPALDSCHIARVGGYTIVGHVPVDVVEQLLREKPVAAGIAVPGMPMGSPGMEGGRKDKYDVILFEKNGKTRVYASR